jgi:hypothetical protein
MTKGKEPAILDSHDSADRPGWLAARSTVSIERSIEGVIWNVLDDSIGMAFLFVNIVRCITDSK